MKIIFKLWTKILKRIKRKQTYLKLCQNKKINLNEQIISKIKNLKYN